ncbi:MAG: hypothetical protein WAV54_06395 [Acidimicrobiales bacterium]
MLLAVSVEIQAAIVGGVIAGVVVLGGIVLAEWLVRLRDRRDRIREAVKRLVMGLPIFMADASRSPAGDATFARGTEAWRQYQEVVIAMNEIDVAVRPPFLKGRREIRDANDDIMARTLAVFSLHHAGTSATMPDLYGMIDATARLSKAVLGDREPIDALYQRYLRQGGASTSGES